VRRPSRGDKAPGVHPDERIFALFTAIETHPALMSDAHPPA
jgi:hypothetical protein